MKDKYDEQIDELMALDAGEFRNAVSEQWMDAQGLFQFLNHSGQTGTATCGCPVMVKDGAFRTAGRKMDQAVRKSSIIPDHVDCIPQSREVLEEFARIQRMADKVYGRKV